MTIKLGGESAGNRPKLPWPTRARPLPTRTGSSSLFSFMSGQLDHTGAAALAALMAGVGASAGQQLSGFGPTGLMPDAGTVFAKAPGAPPPGGGFVPQVAASSTGGGVSPNPFAAPPRAPQGGYPLAPHMPAPDAPAPPPPTPLQLLQALRTSP